MFNCRACGEVNSLPILSLGKTPLANSLLKATELDRPEETYPLDLVFCDTCSLLQITETIPPEKLFSEYLYLSSFSDTVLKNASELANKLTKSCKLTSQSLVLEIASNDGYLLKNYKRKGIPILGIEPARNIAKAAEEQGIPTINEFFNTRLAEQLQAEGKAADIIHANNVIAHVADLHGVVNGISTLLKPDGVAVIENHYARALVEHVEFDSIYHEHLCYYSATSFRNLFSQYELEMVDIEQLPVHGGSLRAYFQRKDGPLSMAYDGAERVGAILQDEVDKGIIHPAFYQDFGRKVEMLRVNLTSMLNKLKADGKRIVVYGASAKSTTLLNYFGIGKEIIDCVVDRSTVKQGLYTPGTHLPIYHPDILLSIQPDYVLLLAWNFAEEIINQQAEYQARGGKFIIPIPELKII